MAISQACRLVVLLCTAAAVVACAGNVEQAAKALSEKEPRRCEVTVQDGVVQIFEGEDCTRISRATAAQMTAKAADQTCNIAPPEAPDPEGGQISSDEYESYARSFQDYAREKSRCATTVASYQGRQGGQKQDERSSDDVRLLIAAMQTDAQITAAWINQIPIAGSLAASYFSYKSAQDLQDTLQTAFENAGPRIGSLTMTQSNDGGPGAVGEEGAAPGGSGGDGDQYLLLGHGNQAIAGDGSVISDGRNAAIIAPGQNDSILDPSTTINQESTGEDNPAVNEPVVNTEDNDGSGDNSIIPGI